MESYTPHRPAFLIAILLSLYVTSACGDPKQHDQGAPAETEPQTTEPATGGIVRDLETKTSIVETAHVTLPDHDPDAAALSLVVTKSRSRLDVLLRGATLKTYPIALGGSPAGPKRVQGDSRTPEGDYVLFPHHPSPSFGGSFYVAYPSADDAARGFANGLISEAARDRIVNELHQERKPPHQTALGGLILLHGSRDRELRSLTTVNWTDGCIAMENDDLLELLAAFDAADRPVLSIRP